MNNNKKKKKNFLSVWNFLVVELEMIDSKIVYKYLKKKWFIIETEMNKLFRSEFIWWKIIINKMHFVWILFYKLIDPSAYIYIYIYRFMTQA